MDLYDVVVVGAGPGGYPAAIRAAQLGAKVALVEKENLGGTCLNWGCIPTKTLIASSALYQQIKSADELGITTAEISCDYARMVARKDKVVARLRGGVEMLLKRHGVTLIEGSAQFENQNTLVVRGSDAKTQIKGDKIILATGSASVCPEFLPRSEQILDSRAFLGLNKLPQSLIVLGGGVVGCEFACLAARLGVEVTIVELLDEILPGLDRDLRAGIKRSLKKMGVRLLTGSPLKDIRAGSGIVSGTLDGDSVEAEMLLSAIGRRAFSEELSLENAGLSSDEKGALETDRHGRTAVDSIYAVGDLCSGSTQLAHAATAQGRAVAEYICGFGPGLADELVPSCIFTAPEIASVGMNKQTARERGHDVEIGKFRFAALGKAVAMGENEGFAKWIVDAQSDKLLGASVIGPHATELIAEAALAIKSGLTARELGNTIHAHPTLSEVWMEAAHVVHSECIHAPPARSRRKKD